MELKVKVEQETAKRAGATDRWEVGWRVENLGEAPLKILAARAPHGKFRCDEKELAPAVDLGPNQTARVELRVRCNEAPGTEIENAFLIFRALCDGIPWLILARLRVAMSRDGAPATTTELVTAQPVGFSSQSIKK